MEALSEALTQSLDPAPELLEQRLPVFVGDDASGDVMSNDTAIIHTLRHQRADELYFTIVGDW